MYGWAQKHPLRTADAVLVAEHRGDEPVVDPGDRERDDADLAIRTRGRRSGREGEAGHPAQSIDRVRRELALVGGDAVEPDLGERANGGGHRHRTERRSGCRPPLGRAGPPRRWRRS